jgi:hypothetical protein
MHVRRLAASLRPVVVLTGILVMSGAGSAQPELRDALLEHVETLLGRETSAECDVEAFK